MEEEILEEEIQVQEEMYSGGGGDLSDYVKKYNEYEKDEHEYGVYIIPDDIGVRMSSVSGEGFNTDFNMIGYYNSSNIMFDANYDNLSSSIEMVAFEDRTGLALVSREGEIENVIEMSPTETIIKNVVTPQEDGDAVNKGYIDSIVGDINSVLATLTLIIQ